MNISENKSFCPLPWINISSDTDGSARLCCISDRYIKKENGEVYNLGHDTVADIINSADYKNIRQDMINGKLVNGCERCYNAEKNNGKSYRKQYITSWEHDENFIKKYNQSLVEDAIDPTVEYYDLRFGNLCNLACRSCYSGASSQFDKELRNIQHTSIQKFHSVNDKDLNSWYETEMFSHNINSQLANMKEYYVTGGEPTLIEKNYEILTNLIQTGHSKHCKLKLNTNLTNTKKDFYSLLKHFKQVVLMASIDGYADMQEYLRYPSNWKQISSNLERLLKLELDNMILLVTPVIQKTNIGYITELFEYIEEYNRQYKKQVIRISPIILMGPDYLDFNYLPASYKVKCWEKIDTWLNEKCQYQDQNFHSAMNQIKTKCFTEVDYHQNLKNFFEFTEIFDNSRSESLSKLNPELYSFHV